MWSPSGHCIRHPTSSDKVDKMKKLIMNAFTPKGVDVEAVAIAAQRELLPVLQKIAAQETPSANATVKRMANLARDAIVTIP